MKLYGTRTASMITLTTSTLYKKLVLQKRQSNFSLPQKSSFLFRGMIRNGIPRVCFYICSTEWNSELFSLPLKCSEENSEGLVLYLFNRTEFRVVFSSAEGFGTEFRGFSVPRNSRNSVGKTHLFRLSEILNPIRRLDGKEEDTIVLEDDGVEGTFAQRIGDWDSFNFPEDLFATEQVLRKRTKVVLE
jgi:hypothetical protein